MSRYEVRFCNYCQHSIVGGQRWVREKIYDPRFTSEEAAYRYFHAEPREGRQVSCWEQIWMERELARTAVVGRNTGQAVSLRV